MCEIFSFNIFQFHFRLKSFSFSSSLDQDVSQKASLIKSSGIVFLFLFLVLSFLPSFFLSFFIPQHFYLRYMSFLKWEEHLLKILSHGGEDGKWICCWTSFKQKVISKTKLCIFYFLGGLNLWKLREEGILDVWELASVFCWFLKKREFL